MPDTTIETPPFDERLQVLLDEGRSHVEGDRLDVALCTFERAERLADELGDRRAADRAWLNRCSLRIAMQREEDLTVELLHRIRQILMEGLDAVNSWLAAYNMAQVYELTKSYRKGLFYAQIALDRCRALDSKEWLASSHNQVGLILLELSRFKEARASFETALELLPADEMSVRRAAIQDNLGYVCMVTGDPQEGFRLLYTSLRTLQRLGTRREQVFPHLRLCFAYLEIDRPRPALRHGVRALALAEEFDEPVAVQYALYLLGEAAQLAGDTDVARSHFQRLQQSYFPNNPGLPELLLTVDLRQLVNLKA